MKKISLILALLMSTLMYAQESFEGKVDYELSYEDMNEQVKAMESMLPKKSMVHVKGEISKTTTPNGMGSETIVYSNKATGESITLMDMMGNKIALRSNLDDLKDESQPEIEYSEETKEILGYKCKKAIISTEGSEIEVEVFYTEELPNIQSNPMSNGIKGLPMQISIEMEPYTIIQTVKKIEKVKVKKLKFEVPSDYKEMTQDELKKMMGGGM